MKLNWKLTRRRPATNRSSKSYNSRKNSLKMKKNRNKRKRKPGVLNEKRKNKPVGKRKFVWPNLFFLNQRLETPFTQLALSELTFFSK